MEEGHEGVVSSEGESAYLHLVYSVDVELGEELHVVVDVGLVALEVLAEDDAGAQ